MLTETIDPPSTPEPRGGYAQGLRVSGFTDLVVISGQIPETADGHVPDDFAAQCRLAWANLVAVLEEAGLTVEHLVKVTTFLSDRRYAAESSEIRQEVLGDHRPALTVIITGIYDERWLLEIEALAAT